MIVTVTLAALLDFSHITTYLSTSESLHGNTPSHSNRGSCCRIRLRVVNSGVATITNTRVIINTDIDSLGLTITVMFLLDSLL